MSKLFQRQLAKASRSGQLDLDTLASLVTAAYDEAERDRRRTDRSIGLMASELQQSHMRLLQAFDVVPEGLVLLNADGQYVHFNRRFVELYDTARDKIKVGASFADSIRAGVERGHYLDAIGREEAWLAERLVKHSIDHSAFEQHIAGDRWVRVEERRLPDGGSIGVRIDITDLKRREEALKRRSEQLLEAQNLGKIGDWSYRFGERDCWLSSQIYAILRYDPATFRPTREALVSFYVANAKDVLASQAEVIRTGNTRSIDASVKRGDGSVADVVITSKTLRDDGGAVIGLHGTIQDISERKRAERELETLAYYDSLTGLANRALFNREINDALTRLAGTDAQAALMILDLDRFKEVNDSLGHTAGDELLAKIGKILSSNFGERYFCARLGGDEFAVVVSNFADMSVVDQLAADIISTVSGTIALERGEVSIGTSVGIAISPRDGTNRTDLQRNADLALYRAKEEGRGRFKSFEPSMNVTAQHKITLARELRHAIQDGSGLSVHYQPQVSLKLQTVTGFEALMRWNHATLGSIPPAKFIPIAESSGLICDLGLWILRHAALQARAWIEAGEAAREIAVNVSAAQIWHANFVGDVAHILEETGLPPHLLCLELTESLLADHTEDRVREVLSGLKNLGLMLALDDFGTGYSSLGYLTQLPFDKLKIDRMFVDGTVESDRARKLLGGMIALGHGLGMTIVAEGAETQHEVSILEQFRCDAVQGYVYARPSPAPEALRLARLLDGRQRDVAEELAEPSPTQGLTTAA